MPTTAVKEYAHVRTLREAKRVGNSPHEPVLRNDFGNGKKEGHEREGDGVRGAAGFANVEANDGKMDGTAGAFLFLPEAVEKAVGVGNRLFSEAGLGGGRLYCGSAIELFLVIFVANTIGSPILQEEFGLGAGPAYCVAVDDDDIVDPGDKGCMERDCGC